MSSGRSAFSSWCDSPSPTTTPTPATTTSQSANYTHTNTPTTPSPCISQPNKPPSPLTSPLSPYKPQRGDAAIPPFAREAASATHPRLLTSTIPCSLDGSFVVVDWGSATIRVVCFDDLCYEYGFKNCWIRSSWTQRSILHADRIVRRAVLCVQSSSEWQYTLVPEQPFHEELVIPRLCQCLGHLYHSDGSFFSPRQYERLLPLRDVEKSFNGKLLEGRGIADGGDILSVLKKKPIDGSSSFWNNLFCEIIVDFSNILFKTCSTGSVSELLNYASNKMGIKQKRLDSLTFGNFIHWQDEPILPVQIFYCRHGQQTFQDDCDTTADFNELGEHLDNLGKTQTLFSGKFVEKLTQGFKSTLAIWSSRRHCSAESAQIIKSLIVSELGGRSVPHIYSNLLDELIPPYPYIVDEDTYESYAHGSRPSRRTEDASTLRGTERSYSSVASLKKKLDSDAKLMEESRWLVSAAMRCSGILVPRIPSWECPLPSTTLGGDIQEAKLSNRLPQLALDANECVAFGGVYLRDKPTQMKANDRGAVSFVYCGHANTMLHQIFDEMGFPKHFWRHVRLPHGAVILGGSHQSGKPSIIIADASYLMNYGDEAINIPYTFTPHIQCDSMPLHGISRKGSITNEQYVSLVPEEKWFSREIMPGVRFDAPPETHSNQKNILMIRSGHNILGSQGDLCLSQIGRLQLQAAGHWLGKFLRSGMVVNPPVRWAIAGLTSPSTSVDISLRESVIHLKDIFQSHFGEDTLDRSLISNESSLFPEHLLAAAESDGELYIVMADDYHLLKYFGAAFGVDPSALNNCFWPHAGYLLISQTERGWPEMRIFGNVAFMPPSLITF